MKFKLDDKGVGKDLECRGGENHRREREEKICHLPNSSVTFLQAFSFSHFIFPHPSLLFPSQVWKFYP